MTTTWEPPAGGHWALETVHASGAQARLFQERAPGAFKAGFQRAGVRYGMPIDYLDLRFVNDHLYSRMRPLGQPEPKVGKASRQPPAFLLKLLVRVHPEMRRRARAARSALAERRWLEDLDQWTSGERDEMLRIGRALQAEPIEAYSDDELVDHLGRVADHFTRGTERHFELVPLHSIPVGRYVVSCRQWGIADRDALALLSGSSPASAASTTGLARIAAACASAGVDPETLDDVRAASAEAAAALDDYLADHAWRMVTQYTPRGLTLGEMPEVLVKAIRSSASSGAPPPEEAPDSAPLRTSIPEAERGRFDELLDDARRCYGNRDDNVALNMVWPVGLMRRVLLEVGRRLAERGIVERPTDVFVLGERELAGALNGDATLGEDMRARVTRMAQAEAEGAPPTLGLPEGPPPDMSVFPSAMAEITSASMALFTLEGLGAAAATAEWTGEGIGVGTAPYKGRACVAASPEEALALLEPGDVLVAELTTPAYEAIMAIAGAVVTEHGGLLSHTALVARECGIPAVVGVAGATQTIRHGALIEVDPVAGRVRL